MGPSVLVYVVWAEAALENAAMVAQMQAKMEWGSLRTMVLPPSETLRSGLQRLGLALLLAKSGHPEWVVAYFIRVACALQGLNVHFERSRALFKHLFLRDLRIWGRALG
jgi:hypothetical protein